MANWIRLTTGVTPQPVFVNMDRAGLVQDLPDVGSVIKFGESFHLAVHETPEQIFELCDSNSQNGPSISGQPHMLEVLRPQ